MGYLFRIRHTLKKGLDVAINGCIRDNKLFFVIKTFGLPGCGKLLVGVNPPAVGIFLCVLILLTSDLLDKCAKHLEVYFVTHVHS